MLSTKFFSLCVVLYQVQGTPQLVNIAWIHPTSMMAMNIRPYPDPGLGATVNTGMPSGDKKQPQTESSLDDESRENSPLEGKIHRQNSQRVCDPRKWFQRTFCVNSTTVRTCTWDGTYRDTTCAESWSCVAGFCMRTSRSAGTFTCPEPPGTYPDSHNCRVYYVCPDGNKTGPTTNVCYYPQIYDPKSQSCQMETSERPCYKINCVGRKYAAYPGDPNIYATCSSSGTVEKLNRCDLGTGWVDETQQCETHYCFKEGNIPADQPTQYYTCSRIYGRLFRSEVKKCLGRLVFNSTVGLCSVSTNQNKIEAVSTVMGSKYETSTDSGSNDTAPTDNGSKDMASKDTGSNDMASIDTDLKDSASTDTSSKDSGSADMSSKDTSSTDGAEEAVPSGRKPSAIVETLYHEVPGTEDLVRGVHVQQGNYPFLKTVIGGDSATPTETSHAHQALYNTAGLESFQLDGMLYSQRPNYHNRRVTPEMNVDDRTGPAMKLHEQVEPEMNFPERGGPEIDFYERSGPVMSLHERIRQEQGVLGSIPPRHLIPYHMMPYVM